MILNDILDDAIIIFAFRYTLGRHSYAPGLMMNTLDELWDDLNQHTKTLILNEIEEHEKHLNRFSDAFSYIDKIDLQEWLTWREKKLLN